MVRPLSGESRELLRYGKNRKLSELEPWLAVNFSMSFPGLGHLYYTGKISRGLLWIIPAFSVSVIPLCMIFNYLP